MLNIEDTLRLRNMVNQSVQHLIETLNIQQPEEKFQHYERVCIAILDSDIGEEYVDDVTVALQVFLQEKANELGVQRDYN